MPRAVFALVGTGTLLFALAAGAARAPDANRFTAVIAPMAVQPLSTSNYTVQIDNRRTSDTTANNAHAVVPDGFVVNSTSLVATTTAADTCAAATWSVALNTSTIDAVAPDPGSELCPGATLTITFGASAPSGEATYTWATTLFHNSSPFGLQGALPTVSVDGTPPSAPTITSAPSDPSNEPAPSFSFTDGDNTATFVCQLDAGAATACTSPEGYSGLGEGAHTFAVHAVDPAGNQSAVTSFGWTIDRTPPPAPTITSAPPSVTNLDSATFAFVDDEAGAGFECRLDGAGFAECTSPRTYNGLAEGTHTFQVEAVDAAGNESTVTTYTWTIDLTAPPPPTITSSPPSFTNSTSASFSFVDAEPDVTFRCRLDGGAFSDCTSPITYQQLDEGGHTFRVRAVDQAGNQSAVTSYSWTIDLTPPPAPTITSAPPSVANSTSATFAFTDGDSSAGFRCRLDGAGFSACTSPITYNGLAEGVHTFQVKAVDPAGNESSVTSYTWTVDVTPPPAPSITSAPPAVTDSTSATFAFVDGDASAGFECRLDNAGFSDCTSPITYDELREGSHTFRVKAVDTAGNESTVTSYTWTIDLTNPVVTIDPASEPHDPTNQTSASFVFTSNKPNSTFECRLDGSEFSPCSSPQTYQGLADARHSFGVRATDELGHVGLPSTYDWTVDTTAPVTTITTKPPPVTDSPSATFEFSSSEANSSLSCSLDGTTFAACSSPQIYVGLAEGSHIFQVQATDLAGNTEAPPASYSWRVATAPPPDTIPPGPVGQLRRVVGYRQLRLTWSDPTDPDVAYVRLLRSRKSGSPATKVVYQGTGTTYADKRFQNGTYYRYEIRAYDTSGNASSMVRVVVPKAALLRSPRDRAVVKAPPLLLWAGVRRAAFYNVQLYRGSQKVLSSWPSKPRLKLHSRWSYNGHRYRLRKGVYHWWVWPAFGRKGTYGQLLGTSTFVVR